MEVKNDSVVESLALMRTGGGNVHMGHRPQGSSSENVLVGGQNGRRGFWVEITRMDPKTHNESHFKSVLREGNKR